MTMRALGLAAVFVAATFSGALAMSSSDKVSLDEIEQLLAEKDFKAASDKAQMFVQAEPWEADGHNLLGYSLRQQKRYDEAQVAYVRALKLDPNHLGAREYLGELFVQTGNLAMAKAQLSEIEALCGTSCTEYEALSKSIASAE